MSRFEGHTPAPWTVTRSKMATDGAFDYAISADGAPVLAEAFGRDAKGGWPPAEANARLIAAAPDLAAENEMLRSVLLELNDALDDGLCNSGTPGFDSGRLGRAQDAARAALAKEPAS